MIQNCSDNVGKKTIKDLSITTLNHTGVLFSPLTCLPSSVFPRGYLLTSWSSPAVDSTKTGLMPFGKPRQQWVSKIWLRFTSSHTHTRIAQPSGLKLTCHTLTTGKVTAATQTRFNWLCLMSVGHPDGYVVPKPLPVQGTVGTGTVIFLCCFLTVNAPLCWKNCLCLESWDINNTHSCLSSPFFSLHLCLWIPSFLQEREKQNSAFFLSFSVLRGSKQSQYSHSFYHDLFSTKGLGNSNEEFFPLQIPFSWCEEGENNSIFSTSKNRISFSTW